MADTDIWGDIPSEDTLTAQFNFLLKYWKNRNLFIRDMRRALGGLNDIEGPKSAQYVVKVLHTYILASIINEKSSRYLPRPVIQVVPDNPLDDESRAKSTRIEQGINVGGYEIERRAGGDCYDRAVRDALLLDMGVQRIVSGHAAYWKDIVQRDTEVASGKASAEVMNKLPPESEERLLYKQEMGIPINKDYVPLEFFFPFYDGKSMPFSFEIEERSLYNVLNNPLYKNDIGKRTLNGLTLGPDGGLNQTVNIIQFANDNVHAYFLGGPGANTGNNKYPRITPNSVQLSGKLMPLYAYEHGINRSIYNTYSGRFGGWKTDRNEIERVGKGIMELSQAADEIVSQVLTNVRATYWPSLNFQLDPEKRGFGTGNSKPEPPKIKEGEGIVTFVGEAVAQIFKPEENPMAMWLFDTIQTQIGRLAGSSTLFGERAPGVDTGYNQAIQQTQAESLDNKQEQHLQAGAEEEALIVSLYAKRIGEPIPMVYVDEDKKTKKKALKYATLDPDDLSPMPRFSAQVRKQRPVDYIAALRAFREATDDRGGKGPALSDDTAREELLSISGPDIEYNKILIESQKRELIANGFITDKVGEQANVKLAKTGTPNISPEILQKADPQLLAAIQQIQPAAAQQGGTDPKLLADTAETVGLPPGPVPGDAEMGNRVGEAIQGNINTGAASI